MSAQPQRVFVSGHSLLDQPLPSYLEAIAASLGTPIEWNRQYMMGSSIQKRSCGDPPQGWAGYRRGSNREGEGLDVVAELRQPRTVAGGPYDTLLITEQHSLVGTLVWNDTVRHLRHYHDRFVDGSPAGRTWFFESWLGIDDKSDPRPWIAYERAASPAWQCIVGRINASLAAAGRSDRIEPLPAGWALARLIERAIGSPGVRGVSAASVRETVDRLLQDDVHLTPLGCYYIALVVYASMFRRSPGGAWSAPGVAPECAASLQASAWEAVTAERAARPPIAVQAWTGHLGHGFIARYATYQRSVARKRDPAALLRPWWVWAKHSLQWHWRLREGAPDHPLRFDPATDAAYWFKAP